MDIRKSTQTPQHLTVSGQTLAAEQAQASKRTQPLDVCVVGTLACDELELVDRLPIEDGFCQVRSVTHAPGGSAANAAYQLAVLGSRVAFSGAIGDDAAGNMFARSLTECGIDTSGLRVRTGGTTTTTRVTLDGSGSHFIALNMGDAFFSLEPEELDTGAIRSARVFLSDLLPRKAAQHALEKAHEAQVHCVVNVEVGMGLMREFGWSDEDLIKALRLADTAIVNREALAELSGSDDPRVLMERIAQDDAAERHETPESRGTAEARESEGMCEALIVTDGENGSRAALRDGSLASVPAAPLPAGTAVADTTGAGDSFLGGFVFARYLTGKTVPQAMRFGSRCAAINIAHTGARAPRDAYAGLAKECGRMA
jgi:sugar/nucleoside kinase (ribokinase family)